MTKFYVDVQGRYLGGFDGAEPPDGAIEVAEPPKHGMDIWANGSWVVVQVVPEQVTSRQAHAAIIMRGHDTAINAYINAITDPVERNLTRNEYERSTVFERNRPLVLTIGAALSLDLDELFIFAATL